MITMLSRQDNAASSFFDRARRSPNRAALVFEGEPTTYRDLTARVRSLAAWMAVRGIRPGDRVAYIGGNHPALVEVLLATLARRAVFVPVNPRLSPAEVAFLLDDAGVVLVVAHESHATAVDGVAADGRALIVVPAASAAVPVERPDPDPAAGPEFETGEASDPAVLMYTSGTTGRSKGVVITHGNLSACILSFLLVLPTGEDNAMLAMAPLVHVAALALTFMTLATGGTVVVLPAFEPAAAFAAIARHDVRLTFGVPTMLRALTFDPAFAATDMSRLLVLCAGAPVPDDLLVTWLGRGARITQGYGLTECTGTACLLEPDDAERKLGSAGLPFPLTAVELRDPAGATIDQPGVAGEICVRGATVTPGYWRNPDATAEAFHPDGWLRTGDAGLLDEDGYLFVTDRIKDMMITGGLNVYPAEVERVLIRHPAVAQVAVLGLPDEEWGETITAAVVPAPGAAVTLEELRDFARTDLAAYKLPRSLSVVDVLPYNAAGKVLKRELRSSLTR